MEHLRVPHQNDDWIYTNFYNNMDACSNFLYAYTHLQRPSCPIHGLSCIAAPIHTENQKTRYGRKGANVFWKCPSCSKGHAMTNGSYLSGLQKLQWFKVIKMFYKFYQGRTAFEASQDDALSYDMCRLWYDWIRRCISHYMQNYYYPNFVFDSRNPTEWGESSFAGKQKHRRGRLVGVLIWVLGGVQRRTKLIVMNVVDDRTGSTLIPMIYRHCPPGAMLITDEWAGYNALSMLGFQHWSVNHSYTFLDPLTGLHSNTIENMFGCCKHDLRKYKGLHAPQLQQQLDAWCFKHNMENAGKNYWEQLLMVCGATQQFVRVR